MNVALVYDTITEFGGAERVLQAFLRAFPLAHVYTLLADTNIIRSHFPTLSNKTLHTHPFLPYIAGTHTSLLQAMAPLLWKHFNFKGYDVVISTPAHIMSNFISVPTIHIQYIHSLPKNLFSIEPPTPLQRYTHYDAYCTPLYIRSIRSTPYLLTNSNHMKRTIFRHTGGNTTVIHPPIILPSHPPVRKPENFYVYVGRLDRAKHIELAIKACNTLMLPLKIVGISNEPKYDHFLRAIAGPTVSFLGYRTDKEIHNLYQKAKAMVFTSKNEDFGITPLEAMAHGVPVIGYYGGGTKETIIDTVTGVFFYAHTEKAMIQAIQKFQNTKFYPKKLYDHASLYGIQRFTREISSYVHAAIQ